MVLNTDQAWRTGARRVHGRVQRRSARLSGCILFSPVDLGNRSTRLEQRAMGESTGLGQASEGKGARRDGLIDEGVRVRVQRIEVHPHRTIHQPFHHNLQNHPSSQHQQQPAHTRVSPTANMAVAEAKHYRWACVEWE